MINWINDQKKNIISIALIYAFRKELSRFSYLLWTKPVVEALLLGFKSMVHIPPIEQHWTFERINERYDRDRLAFQKAMGGSTISLLRDMMKTNSMRQKERYTGTVIVMDLTGLTTGVNSLDLIRDQVSFILSQHAAANQESSVLESKEKKNKEEVEEKKTMIEMEVITLLESPGGGVTDYGLAAQQLWRLSKEPGIKLTVCVDKVAASGGYMMAATAHQILAAPFALVGSIGVYGQILNIHDTLQGWGVQDLIFRAGENKAPLGMIGEVTKAGKANIQSMVDDVHDAFREHVVTARPILKESIMEVATGDVWFGKKALENKLIDRLISSDEYMHELTTKHGKRLLKIIKHEKKVMGLPALLNIHSAASSSISANIKNWLLSFLLDGNEKLQGTHLSGYLKSQSVTSSLQTKAPIS